MISPPALAAVVDVVTNVLLLVLDSIKEGNNGDGTIDC